MNIIGRIMDYFCPRSEDPTIKVLEEILKDAKKTPVEKTNDDVEKCKGWPNIHFGD